jgi:hypothetical protein
MKFSKKWNRSIGIRFNILPLLLCPLTLAAATTNSVNFLSDSVGNSSIGGVISSIPHYNNTLVNGVALSAGGQNLGYLVNTLTSTGSSVPQLYFTNFPFGPNNQWGAPILFNTVTSNGNNRSIALDLKDTSTTGTLAVTGIGINIYSPPDRGGDTSGLYVDQSGGGNAISAYNLSSTRPAGYTAYPNNGRAIEAAVDGGKTSIVSSAQEGVAFYAVVTGVNGAGMMIFPSVNTNPAARAITLRTYNNSAEKFFVQMNGYAYFGNNVAVAGTVTQSSDERLKKDIKPIGNEDLDSFVKLNPVVFNWKDSKKDHSLQSGFIAQEVQKIYPHLVTKSAPTDLTPDGTLSLNYEGLIPHVVNALKNFISNDQKEKQKLMSLLNAQELEIGELKKRIAVIEASSSTRK